MNNRYQYLLTLGLLLGGAAAASAQALYNNGSTISVGSGATLYVQGGYQQTTGASTKTDGTMLVTGNVQSTGTLDLGGGTLEVKGDVTHSGTTTPGTGTLKLTGTTNQNVDLAGGSVANLQVDKSTSGGDLVLLNADLTVQTAATLVDGNVRTLQTTKLILPNGATLSGEGAGQFVAGNVQVARTAVSGSSLVNFTNGVAINPSGNNLGNVVVTRKAGLGVQDFSYGVNPNNASYKSIDQIWDIQVASQPTSDAQLTMAWVADNDNGLTMADFANAAAWKRELPGPWVPASTYVNGTGRSITVPVSQFSLWTVATRNAPLPVELLTFTAQRVGSAAQLDWQTASERNNARFDVEVSTNGRTFSKIGEVAGHGTTQQRQEYRFLDARLLAYAADPVYYRLRQVDQDGSEHLTDVRAVRVSQRHEFTAQAWPNPFDSQSGLQVAVNTSSAGPIELTVFDAVGRLVRTQAADAVAGTSVVAVQGADALPKGVYVLKVRQGTDLEVLRLTRE